MSLRLRTILAVVLALLMIALTTVLGSVISSKASRQVEETIGGSLSETAYQMADKLDYFMWSRLGELQVLSRLKTFQQPDDPEAIQDSLNELQKNLPVFTWVGFTDTNGIVLAATGGILKGASAKERPVYIEGKKGLFIGDVHEAKLLSKLLPNPSGEPLQFVDISMPIHNGDGQLVGILAAHFSWEWSKEVEQSILRSRKDRSKQLDALIVSLKDNTVLLGPKELVGQSLPLESVTSAQKGLNGWETETYADGNEYLTGYAQGKGYFNYPGLGWTILVRQPVDIAFSSVQELQNYIIAAGALGALLFALIGWGAAGLISQPLQRISRAADDLCSGKNVQIPSHKGIKDIELLSLSLRNMVDNLTMTESELDKMEDLAHHDKLTGLPNRAGLERYMQRVMKMAEKEAATVTFLYLDLDGFKKVNDTHGHQFGDKLLQQVGERLQGCVRSHEIIARFGGDEFVAVLRTSGQTPRDEARLVAGRMIASINHPFHIDGETVTVGCSVGGAVWPDDAIDASVVMKDADTALYQSKHAGKNRVTFAS
ncbi:diguanylate cyclase domain-containing protein [Paenibacillus gansuensis]|uniref:Diguanylate cyclase domain-containing protein n=1 Tax=Paenibacillus gansuensis TaxID=306542 RepID=A0ABW5PGG3_9BACL